MMDKYMEQVATLGRRLMEIQKTLSDVAWAYDGMVIQYAQTRQKEEQAKAEKKVPEVKEKK